MKIKKYPSPRTKRLHYIVLRGNAPFGLTARWYTRIQSGPIKTWSKMTEIEKTQILKDLKRDNE